MMQEHAEIIEIDHKNAYFISAVMAASCWGLFYFFLQDSFRHALGSDMYIAYVGTALVSALFIGIGFVSSLPIRLSVTSSKICVERKAVFGSRYKIRKTYELSEITDVEPGPLNKKNPNRHRVNVLMARDRQEVLCEMKTLESANGLTQRLRIILRAHKERTSGSIMP